MPGDWREIKSLSLTVTKTYLLFSMGKKPLRQTHFTCHRIKHHFFLFCWYLLKETIFLWKDPFWQLHGQKRHFQHLVKVLAVVPYFVGCCSVRTLFSSTWCPELWLWWHQGCPSTGQSKQRCLSITPCRNIKMLPIDLSEFPPFWQ